MKADLNEWIGMSATQVELEVLIVRHSCRVCGVLTESWQKLQKLTRAGSVVSFLEVLPAMFQQSVTHQTLPDSALRPD